MVYLSGGKGEGGYWLECLFRLGLNFGWKSAMVAELIAEDRPTYKGK